MKRIILSLAIAAMGTIGASAWDLNSVFNSGSLGNILEGVSSTIQNATASNKFTLDELTGTWNYTSPGVQFDSDNSLQRLGGAAAATTIENKLSQYYKKAGVDKLTLTVDENHNFTMKFKHGTLKGTITKSSDDKLEFNFQAFGKINIGKVKCMATKSGSLLNLGFDVKRMISILQKVSAVAKNSSFTQLANLLSKYEGIYAGVKLKKQK